MANAHLAADVARVRLVPRVNPEVNLEVEISLKSSAANQAAVTLLALVTPEVCLKSRQDSVSVRMFVSRPTVRLCTLFKVRHFG